MIGLIIAATVIVAIALLRIGATVEYSDDGLVVLARAGFIKMRIYPKKQKKRHKAAKETREHTRTRRKKDKRGDTESEKKPGLSLDFKQMLGEATNVLGKIKRRLLIKELTVLYAQAGGDPYKMAARHGAALTAMGLTQGALESFFRIKRYNLHTSVDFMAEQSRVYVHATLTIAVWEVLSIGFLMLMLILRSRKQKETSEAVEKTPEEVKN